jgi:hypothetical protein
MDGGMPMPAMKKALLYGFLWFLAVRFFREAAGELIDAPLMLLGGPMQMTPAQYAADIGFTYLIIPAVTTSVSAVPHRGPMR